MSNKKSIKTSAEMKNDIDLMKQKLKEMQKQQKQLERAEAIEKARLEHEKKVEEALELVEIAKQTKLQNGQTFYDFLVSQKARKIVTDEQLADWDNM